MKNIFKITAMITALLFTLLASGCGETQEEKYNKLEKQLSIVAQENAKESKEIAKTLKPEEIGTEKALNIIKEQHQKFIKKGEPIIIEMEKVAKGNPKLEERVAGERETVDNMKKTIKKIEEGKIPKLPWNQ